MSKCSIQCQELMKQDVQNGMKLVNASADLMTVFVIINNIDKGFIWNPNNCECECDKSCDVGE